MIFLAKLEKVEFRVIDILCIYKKKTKQAGAELCQAQQA